jgi:hypothetical protein
MLKARIPILTTPVVLVALILPGSGPQAQPVRGRMLRSLEVRQAEGGPELTIEFNFPIRYLRHAPPEEGASLVVSFSPIAVSSVDALAARRRESRVLPPESGFPLEEVVYEGDSPESPQLELRFTRRVRFSVRQGADFRSLIISLPSEERDEGVRDRTRQLLGEARKAMTAGETGRAILLYTKLLELPEGEHSREALELLGHARERKGQLAQAKAVYQEYLERYPEGEASDRVRQRLQTLVTARDQPAERLRPPRRARREVEFDTFGSVSTAYTRGEAFIEDGESDVFDSSQLADLYLAGMLRMPRLEVRPEFAGSYRHDYLEGTPHDEARISTLELAISQRPLGASSILGRQSRSNGGVLGRFDGARLAYEFNEHWQVGALGGFPLESPASDSIDTDAVVTGVDLGFQQIFGFLDGELFGVLQRTDGFTDRGAVGAELRYLDETRSLVSFFDYDLYFDSLNTLLLVGNWQVTTDLDLNALAEYSNSPVLTTSNALIGANEDSLDEMKQALSSSEIRDLARDRTARSTVLSAGGFLRLTERYQLAGDLTATDYSGTDAEEHEDATGFEFSYLLQLIGSGLLLDGDVNTLDLSVLDGDRADRYSLSLNGRYPFTSRLRANPRFRVDFRDGEMNQDYWRLRPSLRLDYRLGDVLMDAEVSFAWLHPTGSSRASDETLYSLDLGVRYDF